MTLILGCATLDHVILLSDRRLTWITGPRTGTIIEDEENKAVVVCNRLTWAYTGLAKIGSLKTDEWLLDVIGSINPYDVNKIIDKVKEEANKVFSGLNIVSHSLKRHAFMVAGWGKFGSPSFTPFLGMITNFMDDKGNWLSQAESRFKVHIRMFSQGQSIVFWSAGHTIDSSEQVQLHRRLRACINRRLSPNVIVCFMAQLIRSIAAKSKGSVGKNLMVTILPMPTEEDALTIPLFGQVNGVNWNEPMAFYLPAEVDERIFYFPNYTCNGVRMRRGRVYPFELADERLKAIINRKQ